MDPALVHHFFGTKERLFAAAMRLPVVPGELIAAALAAGPADPAQSLGEHLVRTVLRAWDVHEIRDILLGVLRSATTSPQAMAMLREFLTEAIVGQLSAAARSDDPPGPGRRRLPGLPGRQPVSRPAADQVRARAGAPGDRRPGHAGRRDRARPWTVTSPANLTD